MFIGFKGGIIIIGRFMNFRRNIIFVLMRNNCLPQEIINRNFENEEIDQ